MRFIKPQETLPVLRGSMLPANVQPSLPAIVEPVVARLIAVIPPKVSGPKGPVDPEALGNNVDLFV